MKISFSLILKEEEIDGASTFFFLLVRMLVLSSIVIFSVLVLKGSRALYRDLKQESLICGLNSGKSIHKPPALLTRLQLHRTSIPQQYREEIISFGLNSGKSIHKPPAFLFPTFSFIVPRFSHSPFIVGKLQISMFWYWRP
jgi:hypothetical protein